jgi:hypothetical protein
MDDLEEELIPVHPLLGALLQGQQLFAPEVALIVGSCLAGKDRLTQGWFPGFL